MSSILPKNIQNVLVNDMTTSTSIITPFISTSNLISNTATIPTIMMTGSFHATHTNNTIANIFTTGGNVGIGTTSPIYTLDVTGTCDVSTSITTAALFSTNITSTNIVGTNMTAENLRFNNNGSGLIWGTNFSRIYDDGHLRIFTDDNLFFHTTNTTGCAMFIGRTNGNVGINTTAPQTNLHIQNGSVFIGDVSSGFSTSIPSTPGNSPIPNGYRLIFDNSYNSTAGTGMPANKIVLHNNNWVGGFGMEQSAVTYHSGSIHRFYCSTNNISYGSLAFSISSTQTLITTNDNGAGLLKIINSNAGSNAHGLLRIGNNVGDTVMFLNSSLRTADGGASTFTIRNDIGSLRLQATGSNNTIFLPGNSSNIGINTTSPAYTLDVNGDIRTFVNATRSSLYLGNGTYDAAINLWDVAGAAWQLRTGSYSLMIGNGTIGSTINTQFTIVSSGNVGIGTNAPGTRLDVNGAGTIRGNLYVNSAGLGSTPTLNVSPSSNGAESSIGFWQNTANAGAAWVVGHNTSGIGNNNFGIYSGTYGDNTLSILNSGYIGIGTNSPNYKLEVNGTCKITNELYVGNATGPGTIYMGGGASSDNGYDHSVIETRNYASSENTELLLFKGNDISGPSGPDRIRLRAGIITFDTYTAATVNRTAENIRMTIVESGNVGIGTTAPAHKLDVIGTIDATTYTGANIMISGSIGSLGSIDAGTQFLGQPNDTITAPSFSWTGDTNTGIYRPATDTLGFVTNGVERMRVSSSGNIGINTNSPTTAKLVISGSNGAIGLDLSSTDQYAEMRVIRNSLSSIDKDMWLQTGAGSGSKLRLFSNNTETMVLNSGYVGIGTSSPTATLDVNGNIRLSLSNRITTVPTDNFIYSGNTVGHYSLMWATETGNPAGPLALLSSYGGIRFFSLGLPRMIINSGGNIGIGTDAPGSKLHIVEASGTAAGANSGSIILDHDNNGGASSITFRSKVNRSSDYAYIQYQDAATVGGGGEASKFIIGVQNDADDHIILDPSGSVGIGTYSPGFKLHVNGNMRADQIYNNGWFRNYGDQGLYNEDYGCYFYRNDTYYGNWRIHGNAVNNWNGLRFTQADISLMAGEGATKTCGFHYNGTGWGMMLDASRNLFVPGNITAYWSDKRLKTNLQQLSNFDNVLTSLTGYSFNWNEKGQEILQKPSDETEIGLIAQDVQAVIPQAVTINKAGQKLDDPEPFEYLTINYDKIIPFLVEGYKAQRGEIQAQRGEIDELKSKIEHLEQLINKLT